ncbi:NmrA family NAD(P)-binding protein [Occallatibacter riparius]|uniref:NAD(P)H-binding protein n=1 Tax=Occallatibacter riparius TaxID=1002689 RepID=A0A9J7BHR4_9BACT|nr:NAD(P)H-binding protein [Occallatibacter riparius]UWZ82255.1 NAD(P)H-binding protein [Occallatibacter riparius]
MILVTGATGNVGSELIRNLHAAGAPVRALVRKENSAVPGGIECAVGDLSQPASISNALIGVTRVFLLGGYSDMPAVLNRLRIAKVQHVVLLSSRSIIGGQSSNAIVKMWMTSEDAVMSSGIPWTILRPSSFMSNALRWRSDIRASRPVRVHFPNIPIALIDPYDIAAAAAVVLTTGRQRNKTYELSGPIAMLPAEQLEILGRAIGRKLHAQFVPDNEAFADLLRQSSEEFADAIFRFYAKGEFDDSRVVSTVTHLTGQAPRSFEQWAINHASEFLES